MKNLAATFLFGVALTVLCFSFSGTRQVRQGNAIPASAARYEYHVAFFAPPANRPLAPQGETAGGIAIEGRPALAAALEQFLNSHPGWQATPLTTDQIMGKTPVVFVRQVQ